MYIKMNRLEGRGRKVDTEHYKLIDTEPLTLKITSELGIEDITT